MWKEFAKRDRGEENSCCLRFLERRTKQVVVVVVSRVEVMCA